MKDRQNDKLGKKETLTLTRNWSGVCARDICIFYWRLQALHGKQFKTATGKIIEKWDVKHLPWTAIPGMDELEILIPALICHVNQSNGQYVTSIQGCISIKSQHPIGYSRVPKNPPPPPPPPNLVISKSISKFWSLRTTQKKQKEKWKR